MVGIRIDWTRLEETFESHAPGTRAWLHRETGEIVLVGLDAPAEERSRASGPSWTPVEPVPSREQYRMMERFIETVTHPPLKERLQDAIVGKGAFRRFKDVISRFPDERKRWFAFRDVLLHRHIIEWLKEARIELLEMPAWTLDLPSTPSPEPAAEEITTLVVHTELGDRLELEHVRSYMLAWARAHAEEYHYLFGPAAFERLAHDLIQEFTVLRRRPTEIAQDDSPTTVAREEVA